MTRVVTIKHDRSWESRYMKVEELMQKECRKGIQQGAKTAETRMLQLVKCMQEAGYLLSGRISFFLGI